MSDISPSENEAGLSRVFPIFSAVFSVVYFLTWGYNVAAFSYYPKINVWVWGSATATPDNGPPMLYWGWMAYATMAGIAASVPALAVPRSLFFTLGRYLSWLAWAVPLAMCFEIYYWSLHWFK